MAKPKHGTRSPSPAVLSALALIATIPSTVAGSPIHTPTNPPAFLCPFIERDIASQCDVVADKYVQGSDSLWRKTDTWTLFGSTCSTSAVQSQPSPPQTSMSTHTPAALALDASVLPLGWDNASSLSSSTESSIILALAIILASSISFFIISCLIWRRRKKKARDLEHKLGPKRAVHDIHPREKDPRDKMRIWAKATARWKSNVRQSARRRRKRHVSSALNRPLSPTFSPSSQTVDPSPPSRRSSITSQDTVPLRTEAVYPNAIEPPVAPHRPPRSPSPPTYRASFVPRYSPSSPTSAAPSPTSTPLPVGLYPPRSSNHPYFVDEDPLPYVSPSDGHIATDDKSQLARVRQLASSPPVPVDTSSTIQSVSAPEWHEVEDDLDIPSPVSLHFHNFDLPPSFPPPPSKADVHSPFDHILRYGQAGDILSIPGSPGPSLGAFPSAPPFDDPGLEPSAPSLDGEDELFQDWNVASSDVPKIPTLADLDSISAHAIASPASSNVSSASYAPSPCIPESAARDGILPRYHS